MTEVPQENKLITAQKEAGQRVALARILTEEQTHPTIDQIYSHLRGQSPTPNLATVYKTIVLQKDLGLVQEIRVEDNRRQPSSFSLSFDSHSL
jgi:Fe2+ or Zn2+ uptake regulation protein